jgi:membrane protein YdbS with pleckstrin-like domain
MKIVIAAAIGLLLLGAVAFAAERPNALDVRIDALTRSTLMTAPAEKLVDPERQAAAIRRAHWTVFGFVLTQVFEAVALFYLWSSGGAASLRDWLRRRFLREWGVRFCFGAALALVARLAGSLPAFYLYRVDHMLGLTTELTRWWALYWILHTLLAMVIAGGIVAVVLWLASLTHQWFVYAIGGILAVTVVWSYLSPSQLQAFPGSTAAEVRYAGAFEQAVSHDQLSIALIEGGIIIVFAAIAVVVADRFSFRRDDDSLSRLAIVGALLALVYLAAVPVRNAVQRSYDLADDNYAIAFTDDPTGAVRALIRDADQRMVEVCPEWSATAFLYTAPGIGVRVAAINHVPDRCP